jgi:2-keto-3-deoxy-L-fuconate dehydrogenase
MENRTALITCANRYMGRVIKDKFESLGIKVITGGYPMESQKSVEELIASAGAINILVANLAEPPMTGPVQDIRNDDWQKLFDSLVNPLMYLVRAVAPQMIERGAGKIIGVTSAAPIKGIANNAAYCAARGAQNAFLKAVGLELARNNVHVNAIAQNYINNDTYYPDDILDNAKFLDHVKKNVPTNKIGDAQETAELAAYLASKNCNHMIGQIIPLSGGWVT